MFMFVGERPLLLALLLLAVSRVPERDEFYLLYSAYEIASCLFNLLADTERL